MQDKRPRNAKRTSQSPTKKTFVSTYSDFKAAVTSAAKLLTNYLRYHKLFFTRASLVYTSVWVLEWSGFWGIELVLMGLFVTLLTFEIYKGVRKQGPLKRYRLVLRKNLSSVKGRTPLIRPLAAFNKHMLILVGKTRRTLGLRLADEVARLGAILMFGYTLAFTLSESVSIVIGAYGLADGSAVSVLARQHAEDWIDLMAGPSLSDYFIPSYVVG